MRVVDWEGEEVSSDLMEGEIPEEIVSGVVSLVMFVLVLGVDNGVAIGVGVCVL